ncbi:DUF3108 domain-containing protein [Pararobbsia alpina]
MNTRIEREHLMDISAKTFRNHAARTTASRTGHRVARRANPTWAMLVAAACALAVSHAHAAATCDAPWMHTGGGFTLTTSPGHRSTDFSVTQFTKRDADNCSGVMHAKTQMSVGGQSMQSESDVKFEIASSKAHTEVENTAGGMKGQAGMGALTASVTGQTTASMLSYVGEITGEGQRLPGMHSEGSMSGNLTESGAQIGTMSAARIVTTTTDKQVGKQEQLDTAMGKFACWPVSYDRKIEANNVQMMSRTTNLTTVTHVVDHFCPAAGLVLREDMTLNGRPTALVVSTLH